MGTGVKLLIWGVGAIGGTIGAYLIRAGHEVTLVDRAADHVAALNQQGLHITGPLDNFTVSADTLTPEQLRDTGKRIKASWNCVLLCTKAQDTAAATQALVPYLSEAGYVVSVQNGLNELTIANIIGQGRTIGAFVNFGADYLEPGVIHYAGRGAVVLGELDGRFTPRLETLKQLFSQFDDAAITTPNIWGYLWSKLAYGAILFATALTNVPIADALATPAYRELYIALAREVLSVAVAKGIKPENFNGFNPAAFMPGSLPSTAQRSLDDMVRFNRKSAKTHSGVWRDLAVRKRPTEAEAQFGWVVRLGRETEQPTPLTARLLELIQEIEQGVRQQGWEALEALNGTLAPLASRPGGHP